MLLISLGGKRREMGLGGFPEVSLKEARELAAGLLATCNVAGAGNWQPELNKYLTNRKACIVPDNDMAGLDHADKVLVAC